MSGPVVRAMSPDAPSRAGCSAWWPNSGGALECEARDELIRGFCDKVAERDAGAGRTVAELSNEAFRFFMDPNLAGSLKNEWYRHLRESYDLRESQGASLEVAVRRDDPMSPATVSELGSVRRHKGGLAAGTFESAAVLDLDSVAAGDRHAGHP